MRGFQVNQYHRNGVPSVTRRETSRTLPTQTKAYFRHDRGHRVLELSPKAKDLPEGPVDQRAWRRYQAYLGRIRPVARADFYKRLMERKGLKTTRAVARVTGEDHSRVARVLKILELPGPVLEYLRSHDSPATVSFFTEKRLRELAALGEPRRIWQEFRQMLQELGPTS